MFYLKTVYNSTIQYDKYQSFFVSLYIYTVYIYKPAAVETFGLYCIGLYY